jgi:tetratricopeptide (TPR) repeat protein
MAIDVAQRLKSIKALAAAGHLSAARNDCAELTQSVPANAECWRLAGEIALRLGARSEALSNMRRAVECAGGDVVLLVQLCRFFLSVGHRTEALIIARQMEQARIEGPVLLDTVGTLLTHCGDPGSGLRYFAQAVKAAPAKIAFRYNLAMAQRMAGDFEAAETNLDQVLAENPLDGEAQNARSGLRKQSGERNHVVELEWTLRRLDGRPGVVALHFALAKELDDLGEHRRSFACLSKGCRLHRASYRYDVAGDLAVLEALTREHRGIRPADSTRVDATAAPVFVIGLPRSGTTLIERILGSHSQVFAAGELDYFPTVAIEAVTQRCGGSVSKLEFVGRSLEVDFADLGQTYLERARTHTGGACRFTDKLPLNYLYAGLIHAALPQARFVALRRHPVAVCFAMYKTLFASAYPFTYDLIEVARYYLAWDRLMQHWERQIGAAWLTVRYEELVLSQEQQTRMLLAHCGLSWEDGCLQFQRHSSPVATESAVQVRRPLYADSIGHWRAYTQELQPLIEYLEGNGIVCD